MNSVSMNYQRGMASLDGAQFSSCCEPPSGAEIRGTAQTHNLLFG